MERPATDFKSTHAVYSKLVKKKNKPRKLTISVGMPTMKAKT